MHTTQINDVTSLNFVFNWAYVVSETVPVSNKTEIGGKVVATLGILQSRHRWAGLIGTNEICQWTT